MRTMDFPHTAPVPELRFVATNPQHAFVISIHFDAAGTIILNVAKGKLAQLPQMGRPFGGIRLDQLVHDRLQKIRPAVPSGMGGSVGGIRAGLQAGGGDELEGNDAGDESAGDCAYSLSQGDGKGESEDEDDDEDEDVNDGVRPVRSYTFISWVIS